jgi:hypothetical protein
VALEDPVGTSPFWVLVQKVTMQTLSTEKVFDMTSSVRVAAVENLARYQSRGVVIALTQLLDSKDANIRAVAAVRSGAQMIILCPLLMRLFS